MMETVLGSIPESMAASASENARNYFMHRQGPFLAGLPDGRCLRVTLNCGIACCNSL